MIYIYIFLLRYIFFIKHFFYLPFDLIMLVIDIINISFCLLIVEEFHDLENGTLTLILINYIVNTLCVL